MAKQLKYQFDINGQTHTLDFGMYCWETFCEKMDVDPGELLTVFQGGKTFKAMRMVAYCGIIANDYINGQPDSITELDVAKWLNDSPETMNVIFNAAMKTFYGIDEVKEEKKTEDKKKASRSKRSKK